MLTVLVKIVNFVFILSVLDKEILVVTLSLIILVKMQGILDEPERVGKYIAHGLSVDCTRERTVYIKFVSFADINDYMITE
jgi:hypothetical protein